MCALQSLTYTVPLLVFQLALVSSATPKGLTRGDPMASVVMVPEASILRTAAFPRSATYRDTAPVEGSALAARPVGLKKQAFPCVLLLYPGWPQPAR
jgi:hypothetical protein